MYSSKHVNMCKRIHVSILTYKHMNVRHANMYTPVSRDALLVIHIPLLHFSFYPNIPQRNDTSPFLEKYGPHSGVTLTYFIWYVAKSRLLFL